MLEFDLWWPSQQEKLEQEGFSYEEIEHAKELAEAMYEKGFREVQEEEEE